MTGSSSAAPRRGRVLAVIAAGGALGSLARYGVAVVLPPAQGGAFPWATFTVNVTGAFLLGVVIVHYGVRHPSGQLQRFMIATGFLGAYTTFSTFALEIRELIAHSHHGRAVGYALGSVVLGLLAARVGVMSARAIHARPGGTAS